jgi:hypothetical protein
LYEINNTVRHIVYLMQNRFYIALQLSCTMKKIALSWHPWRGASAGRKWISDNFCLS